ncbi:hypothetical protein GCM10009745_79270 [Kribbella yunnanensis]|uniref:AAA+ ATPase domain-containing protein n=1 Tax=Kribbella yunnanensis TaxID=190194 RepID=A0ABP4V8D9_9ACTN
MTSGPHDNNRRSALDELGRLLAEMPTTPSLAVWAVEAPVPGFVNRTELVEEISSLAKSERHGPAVVAIHARAGTGKTELLRRCAATLDDLFDIAIWVDLGGTVNQGRLAPEDVLGGVLVDLWQEPGQIPHDLRGRHRRFLALTAGKRVLVLVDGATDAAPVRMLVPNSAQALVIVAGEVRLDELAGAVVRPLVGLDDMHGLELLAARVGSDRITAEEAAARRLVKLCDGSPLGLTIIANRLNSRPRLRLAQLVEELDSALFAQRAARPSLPGTLTSMTAVFDTAYHWLDENSASLYRTLGHAPSDQWPAEVIAAVPGIDTDEAVGVLTQLDLLHPVDGGYSMPSLVGLHASQAALAEDEQSLRDSRRTAIIDAWLALVQAADRAVTAERFRVSPTPSTAPTTPYRTPGEAMDWFDQWHRATVEVMREAAAQGLNAQVWQLFEGCWPFYSSRSYYQEWLQAGDLAVTAAKLCQDPAAEARVRCLRSRAWIELEQYDDAAADIRDALALARPTVDKPLIASVLDFEGQVLYRSGDPLAALPRFEEALRLSEELGDRRGIALQSQFCGRCLTQLSRYDEALTMLDRALDLIRPFADDRAVSRIELSRAETLRGLGRYDEAQASLLQAVASGAALGKTDLVIPPLEQLADVAHANGDQHAEREYLRRLLDVLTDIGDVDRGDQVQARIEAL